MGALADILRRHGPDYRQRFASRMPLDQLRVMWKIEHCRTPALGGQSWACPDCGQVRWVFHSCGNRHCPGCGHDDAQAWLRRQEELALPIEYYLCTFTVAEPLRAAIRSHPKELLNLLFRTSSSSLLDMCANPEWLGGRPGMTGVLHTWTRAMIYHPHIHYLVTGGGLDRQGHWRRPGSRKFLVPVKTLSNIFRARFRDALREEFPDIFRTIPASSWRQDWVVHAKPVGNGRQTLRYLARYVYRAAIADSAILHHDAQTVTFRYRDSETGKCRKMTLAAQEFIRRFLQHVLPGGFPKVRHYGLHHYPASEKTLPVLRAALCINQGKDLPPVPEESKTERPTPSCPCCNVPMRPGPHVYHKLTASTLQARAPPKAA